MPSGSPWGNPHQELEGSPAGTRGGIPNGNFKRKEELLIESPAKIAAGILAQKFSITYRHPEMTYVVEPSGFHWLLYSSYTAYRYLFRLQIRYGCSKKSNSFSSGRGSGNNCRTPNYGKCSRKKILAAAPAFQLHFRQHLAIPTSLIFWRGNLVVLWFESGNPGSCS